jgi:hypothetical protein
VKAGKLLMESEMGGVGRGGGNFNQFYFVETGEGDGRPIT